MELLIILALAFGAMWFMSRKSRMQQKAAADFRANLAPGQEVMTGSGLFATIVEVEDDVVTLETSPGITSRWLRPAIAKLVEPSVDEDEDEDLDEDADDDYDENVDEDLDEDFDEDAAPSDDDVTKVDMTKVDLTKVDVTDDDEHVDVPDDASSLMNDPDEGDTPRR